MKGKLLTCGLIILLIIGILLLLWGECNLANYLQSTSIFKDSPCHDNCTGIDKNMDWGYMHYIYVLSCVAISIVYIYLSVETISYYENKWRYL